MGKDKGSRPRKASGNKQESASRSASVATAVRVPLPASSPIPESVTGDSSDHEEEMQTEPSEDRAKSPENLEDPQKQDASQVGTDPVLTDDGPLASAQIEPSLGEIVEERANGGAGENIQSPTNTDQSTSPDPQKSMHNLADELEGLASDSSDQDTSSNVAQTEATPEVEESQKPEDTISGQSEGIEEERTKRLAAEEQVRKLKADMKDQRQKFEEEAEKTKKKHEKALEKANKAREAEKVKIEKNAELKLNVEVAKFEEKVERLRTIQAQVKDPGPPASNDTDGDMSGQKKTAATDEELLQAINKDSNPGSATSPIGRFPMASLSRFNFRPRSARFLLAQCEYILDKSTPVYTALRNMADYADGVRDWSSQEDKTMLANFDAQLIGIIELMEDNMDRPNRCLVETKRDWKLAMDEWKPASSGKK